MTVYTYWKGKNNNAVDSTKLSALGNILCGMPRDDIMGVNKDEYE